MSLLARHYSDHWLISREHFHALLLDEADFSGRKAAVIYEGPQPVCEEPDIVRMGSTGVIPICGPILKNPSEELVEMGYCDVDQVRLLAEIAKADPTVERVLLYVSSPGGTWTGLPECRNTLLELAQSKPLYGLTDSIACSAAYYLLSPADEIYVTPSAVLGGIGVYSIYLDATGAYEQMGLKFNPIFVGKFKLAGRDFKEMTSEERAYFQEGMDRIAEQFHEAVNTRRIVDPENMEGQCFAAEMAIQKHLADTMVNSLEEFISLLSASAIR